MADNKSKEEEESRKRKAIENATYLLDQADASLKGVRVTVDHQGIADLALKAHKITLTLNSIYKPLLGAEKLLDSLSHVYKDRKKELLAIELDNDIILFSPLLLSPNTLDPRFNTKEDKVMIITEGLNNAIQKEFPGILDEIIAKGRQFIIVRGPVGIGKSFSLAYNVLKARKKEVPILIFYLNNSNVFSAECIITELFYTLQFCKLKDENCIRFFNKCISLFGFKDILTWSNLWENLETTFSTAIDLTFEQNFRSLMLALASSLDLPVLIIFDQAPLGGDQLRSLQDTIFNLLQNRMANVSILLCSSRLPSLKYKKLLSNIRNIIVQGRFNEDQANKFLKHKLKLGDWNSDNASGTIATQKLDLIKDITANIPYDLFVICQESFKCVPYTEDNLYAQYLKAQERAMNLLHQEFEQRKHLQLKGWILYLTHTYMGIPISDQSADNIDENICCFRLKSIDDEVCYELEFYHPSYKNLAIQKYWLEISKVIVTSFERAEPEMNFPGLKLKAATDGDIMEKYCLYKIESLRASQSDKTWSFKLYDKNGIEGKNPITFQVKGAIEVHAHMIGDAMLNYFNNPHSINDIENTYSGALYIPRSESFEVIDAVFFDPVKKFIFPIQITRNIQTHKKSDIKFDDLLRSKKHNVLL